MTPLLLLAEKVEGLEGADREVDAEIGLLAGGFFLAEPRYPGAVRMYGYVDSDGCRVEPGNGGQFSLVPCYTASLDAAMMLAPEGWDLSISRRDDGKGYAEASHPDRAYMVETRWLATPALATVAVALRARAAMEAGE